MRERALIIANPTAGRGRAWSLAARFREELRACGMAATLLESVQPGDACRRAEEMGGVADVIVSVGGDGTLNEILNGLDHAGHRTPVALLPAGTGNVVGHELRLPRSLPALARVVRDGPVRVLDGPRANGRRFLMCSGVGFDAAIVERVHRARAGRRLTLAHYAPPTVRTLLEYDFPALRVRVDGRTVEDRAFFVVVGNLARYGGPFRFFRDAQPDDGLLDVCCFLTRSRFLYAVTATAALLRTVPTLPWVRIYRGREVRVKSELPAPVQIDGDPAGSTPVTYAVEPARIRLVAPPGD